MAAGLAGGSSDAAATLLGLNRLWQLRLTDNALARLGAELGSDVPFFFHGPAAWCTGRGEIVTPVPVPAHVPPVGAADVPAPPLSVSDVPSAASTVPAFVTGTVIEEPSTPRVFSVAPLTNEVDESPWMLL